MHLAVVGINHKTASVEVREKVAFTSGDVERALKTLSAEPCIAESLILSTCNRTEVYCVFKNGCFDPLMVQNFVAEYNHLCCADIEPYVYQLVNDKAVEHLFRVVSGLDSMVIGENQIAAQAKESYRYATTVRSTGIILNKLFHIAFRVSKKVRTQTGIGTGSLSVSQVACDLAEKIFKHLADRSVLLVGAGENGEVTAKYLRDRGVGKLLITNRTFEKAQNLANRMAAHAVPFEQMSDAMTRVDIVLSSTGAPGTVITKAMTEPAAKRRQVPLFMIDLAIPRDIDPAVDELDNVVLYDMDALQRIIEQSLEHRGLEAHKAKKIIADEVERFKAWHSGHKATPTILEMQSYFESIRQDELEKLKNKLDESDYHLVEAATKVMMNKILHAPITTIRQAAKKGDEHGLIRTLRNALGLGEES